MSSVILGIDAQTGQEVRIGDIERRSGLYILGNPGMGKSVTMVNMMRQDMSNGHGLFFLDPHGDAISDLISSSKALADRDGAILLDPEDEAYSFGINLLACENVASLRARNATYTRAYNVFKKIWENDFGPWLQLILENVLWAFIENQGYTLADVPMFLNPRYEDFRNHIIDNIKYNQEVADFWRFEFFDSKRREQTQQERVDAALTRIHILLSHRYVRDIIGQQKSTLDFNAMLAGNDVWLFKLSANLSEDIKKFIGTILISELLHAVRSRDKLPQEQRTQFCIFIDEFHNFASSDDIGTLVTEGRKFGAACTYAHVERFGQLAHNLKLLGATLAAANKAFFQLTVRDSSETAPEFAAEADAVKTRVGGDLVISPQAVTDIWDRGHSDAHIMALRAQYFWLVDLLRTQPNERYYVFDPERGNLRAHEQGNLHYGCFNDWEMYRATPEMIREGITLLNEFYYEKMRTTKRAQTRMTSGELRRIERVLACFAGVFGWRPTMEPYIPEDMARVYIRRATEHDHRNYREYTQDLVQKNRAREHDLTEFNKANPFRNPWSRSPRDHYWGELPIKQMELEKIIDENTPTPWTVADLPHELSAQMIQTLRSHAISIGFTQGELDELIAWRPRTLIAQETQALTAMIELVANCGVDEATYQREQNRVNRAYTAVMALHPMVEKFGKGVSELPFEKTEDYLRTVVERIVWQMTDMQQFILQAFHWLPMMLARNPVRVQSGAYDEAPKRERTQGEMNDIMSRELANLPRFRAYTKIIDEHDGEQTVKTRIIDTLPLTRDSDYAVSSDVVRYKMTQCGYKLCQSRTAIGEEIKERQKPWRGGSEPPQRSRRVR